MKRNLILVTLLLAFRCSFAATNDLADLVRNGLFQEEANHNLDAAIQSYQSAIASFDDQRQLVATAIFRLGECERKLGRTNDAAAQYARILREFPDQTQLAELSRANLPPTQVAAVDKSLNPAAPTSEETDEFIKITQTIQNSPDLVHQNALLDDAVRKGWLLVAKFLLDSGTDPNHGPPGFGAPINDAASAGNLAMVQLLIEHGATGVDYALELAASYGYPILARFFLDHHANVNYHDNNGNTALHAAASSSANGIPAAAGCDAVAELLLKNGASVNATNNVGRTPLFAAVDRNNASPSTVALLLTNGATVNVRDTSGATPLQLARSDEIRQLLVRAGASQDFQRLGGIYVTTKGSGSLGYLVYSLTRDSAEPHSLLELIAWVYRLRWSPRNNLTSEEGFVPFPDFTNIVVHRITAGGEHPIEVNLAQIFTSNDCSKDIPLQWGDVVEVAQIDHSLRYGWKGLPLETVEMLKKCLGCTVQIVVKGQTNVINLEPSMSGAFFGAAHDINDDKSIHYNDLNSVVRTSNLLLLSSDLTRVKLTHVDGRIAVFNLDTQPPPNPLLHDGDIIEIPEK